VGKDHALALRWLGPFGFRPWRECDAGDIGRLDGCSSIVW